jgi:hypothetical protein
MFGGSIPPVATMKKSDMQALREVLRHISTSRQDIQSEVLRLDDMLARLLNPKNKEEQNDRQQP